MKSSEHVEGSRLASELAWSWCTRMRALLRFGVLASAACGWFGCATTDQDRDALLDADPTVCPPSNAGTGVVVRVCRQAWIGGLAIDAQYLYFLAGDTLDAPYANTVKRVPIAGGMVEVLGSFEAEHDLPDDTSAENGSWLAVNSTELVWAVPSTGQILAMAKDGSEEPRVIASGQDIPLRVAVDETRAYWTNWSSCGQCAEGSVHAVPLAGGQPTVIASKQDHPNGITVDAVNVYWVTAGGNVLQAPLVGGAPITLASGQFNPFFVTVDATNVYWTLPERVMSCSIVGCNRRPTQIVTGLKAPNVITSDATALYFTDWDEGTVVKLMKARKQPSLIAAGLERPNVVVLGGNSVFWYTAGPEGSIMSAPK